MSRLYDDLRAQFEDAKLSVAEARAELAKEPVIKGQRGGSRPSPWHYMLRDRETNLVRLARLLADAKEGADTATQRDAAILKMVRDA
jgi:hypothetical protein